MQGENYKIYKEGRPLIQEDYGEFIKVGRKEIARACKKRRRILRITKNLDERLRITT